MTCSVLIVPGAWHKPDHYRPLIEELADFDVHTVALTSSGDEPAELRDMYADADAIAQAVATFESVVVIAHSYGGVPTTQALTDAPNVRRIIYLASFPLEAGESLVSLNPGNAPLPWSKRHRRRGIGDFISVTTPETVFFNDLDRTTAAHAVAQLGYQSYSSMRQPLTTVAWKNIPSSYIMCEADNAVPVAVQKALAERVDAVYRLTASHSPFLSQPAALARLIRQAVDA